MWYLWPLGAQLVACYECWAVKWWMFYMEPKGGSRAGVKTILCAVSRNDFSELLQWSRKQWLKWGAKTGFKQQRFTVELKTDLRCRLQCLSLIYSQISQLYYRCPNRRDLCPASQCGMRAAAVLWPLPVLAASFFSVHPQPVCLWQQVTISHFVRGLQSQSEQGPSLRYNPHPLQTMQSKRGWGLLESERCLVCFKLCTGNTDPCDLKGGS